MKKLVYSLWLLVCLFNQSMAVANTDSFSRFAYQMIDETWRGLGNYGLLRLSAWDAHLPRPQVPALEAVVSRRVGLLAYYDEETYGFVSMLVFKNPDGGMRHAVTFNRDRIEFQTPYAGVVAHANRFMTVGGPAVNFYCQSQPVTEFSFYQCVQGLYINVIVNQLKQFGE